MCQRYYSIVFKVWSSLVVSIGLGLGLSLISLAVFPVQTPAVQASTHRPWPDTVVQASPQITVYLPVIFGFQGCALNSQEQAIATYMQQDPQQQRPSLTCNTILAQVARQRAEDMAQRNYFSHTNPEGYGPNYLVTQAGYVLPWYYGTAFDANNIESIAAGNSTASATWQQWMNSPGHRTHLLGLNSFYAEQIQYGIGYAANPSSQYRHYWVVITAKPGP